MEINAAWENRGENLFTCRWFCAWRWLDGDTAAGVVAGYGGGGSFEAERFWAKLNGQEVRALWIDMEDRISGESIDFDSLGDGVLTVSEEAFNALWAWCDNDAWCDCDQLILLNGKEGELSLTEDMAYLGGSDPAFVRTVCEKAGLTAGPSKMYETQE